MKYILTILLCVTFTYGVVFAFDQVMSYSYVDSRQLVLLQNVVTTSDVSIEFPKTTHIQSKLIELVSPIFNFTKKVNDVVSSRVVITNSGLLLKKFASSTFIDVANISSANNNLNILSNQNNTKLLGLDLNFTGTNAILKNGSINLLNFSSGQIDFSGLTSVSNQPGRYSAPQLQQVVFGDGANKRAIPGITDPSGFVTQSVNFNTNGINISTTTDPGNDDAVTVGWFEGKNYIKNFHGSDNTLSSITRPVLNKEFVNGTLDGWNNVVINAPNSDTYVSSVSHTHNANIYAVDDSCDGDVQLDDLWSVDGGTSADDGKCDIVLKCDNIHDRVLYGYINKSTQTCSKPPTNGNIDYDCWKDKDVNLLGVFGYLSGAITFGAGTLITAVADAAVPDSKSFKIVQDQPESTYNSSTGKWESASMSATGKRVSGFMICASSSEYRQPAP